MRRLFALLAAVAAVAAFTTVGAGMAFAGGGGGGGGGNNHCDNGKHKGDKHCDNGGNGGCHRVCPPRGASPGADCTDFRQGVYLRVNNALYACLFPKNNTAPARARSTLICETPTAFGGQGGTAIDADGLAFICVGPSGPQ